MCWRRRCHDHHLGIDKLLKCGEHHGFLEARVTNTAVNTVDSQNLFMAKRIGHALGDRNLVVKLIYQGLTVSHIKT